MIPKNGLLFLLICARGGGGGVVGEELEFVLLEELLGESFATSASLLERDVGFWLLTRRNPDEAWALRLGEAGELRRSPFRPGAPTKLLVHGWTDTGRSEWLRELCRSYLSAADYNVVIVDWSAAGSLREYLLSARLTRQVGEQVGRFVEFLVAEGLASFEAVHIVGHSLGAHVAGFAGSRLSGRLGRITGLDPARPDFEAPLLREPRDRLDPTDAAFVDVIHTCAGTAGFVRPLGHADFYPNGGSFRQPGCPLLVAQYCSHGRSHQFMGESIASPRGFPAVECSGWKEFRSSKCDRGRVRVYMGEWLDRDARGVFYLETNAEAPFARGQL